MTGSRVNSFSFSGIHCRAKMDKTQICLVVGEMLTFVCVCGYEDIIEMAMPGSYNYVTIV